MTCRSSLTRPLPLFLPAFLLAAGLVAAPLGRAPAQGASLPAVGTLTPVAQHGEEESPGDIEMKKLKERLRELGDAIRSAIDDARRSMERDDDMKAGRGGLGALAPRVTRRNMRAIYGPKGPTLRSVKALLNYRLVLLGNERLTAGRVFERDERIIAEVITVRERALVTRYMINKKTGVWVPEG